MDIIERLQTYYRVNTANQGDGNIPVVSTLIPNSFTDTVTAEPDKLSSTPIMLCTPTTLLLMENNSPDLEFIVLSNKSSLAAVRDTLDTNARSLEH